MRSVTSGLILLAVLLGALAGFTNPGRAGDGKGIKVTAEALAREFKDNKDAATDKYRGKTLVVTGVSGGNSAVISTLYLKATQTGPTVVKCFYFDTPAKEKARIEAVKPKMKVTISGEFRSYLSDHVELGKCTLVKQEK